MTEDPQVQAPRSRWSRFGPAALALGFVGLAGFLFAYAAGPVTWDELLYLSTSVRPEPAARILNRFAHVYAQKVCVALTGDAITGARLYWSLLVAGTTVLVFLCARRLASSFAAGVLAVLLFFAVPLLFGLNGLTYADVTVMFLGVLALWLVLGRPSRVRLVALGGVLFLALKSKESAVAWLPVILVVAGAAVEPALRLRRLGWILLGGALGLGLLMGLDAVFLGDALFQVRWDSLRACLAFNQGREFERTSDQWLLFLGSRSLLFPFLCYVLALRFPGARPGRGVVGAVPLVLVVFLTLTMIRGPWGVVARYLLPALPALAIGGAMILEGRLGAARRPAALAAGLAGLLAGLVLDGFAFRPFVAAGWDRELFRDAILYPLAFAAFLGLLWPRPAWGRRLAFSAGAAAVFLLVLPAYGNLKAMAAGNLARQSRARFAPLELLSRERPLLDGAVVLVSGRLYERHKLLARDGNSARWMLQIHFNEPVDPRQVIYGDSLAPLRAGRPDYALVARSELTELRRVPEIESAYEVVPSEPPARGGRRRASAALLRRR